MSAGSDSPDYFRFKLGSVTAFSIALLLVASAPALMAQSLQGGSHSLDLQNRQAARHDFSCLRHSEQLQKFVKLGLLVKIDGNDDFRLKDVSYPYARPEVRVFIYRLARQYHNACGEQLVVTSLTRPTAQQPRNASSRSVHPTGMALDLRRENGGSCRTWLENTLLHLESRGVLEATKERVPPHYHVAVFPRPYREYVAQRTGQPPAVVIEAFGKDPNYEVRRKDTLWRIAQRYGTTPGRIQRANGLASTRILPGQVLRIPIGTDTH